MSRFVGDWTGGGTALTDGMSRPHRVTCRLAGETGASEVRIAGTCRALAIFSRGIAASLNYDPASGRYTGIYEGARAGPARLSGHREGNTLHLIATWTQPIHGHPQAEMTIVNEGDGTLRIVVEHPFGPATSYGGPVRSADLELNRR